jgi:hypothetical protein
MAGFLDSVSQILLPKGKGTRGGVGSPPGFNPARPLMTVPAYREHLTDIYAARTAQDSRTLLNDLFNTDPDVSAAVHSYLTIAAAGEMVIYAYNPAGEVDLVGIQQAHQLLTLLTVTNDYTVGFSSKPTLDTMLGHLRYMMLLRGACASELVLDKTYAPTELRLVDTATLRWNQPKPNVYLPEQRVPGNSDWVDLNVPTFFYQTYHQNPTNWYSYSPFVAAINTIAARAEVINELYRIMKVVGYPRLDVTVLENVLLENAPPNLRTNLNEVRTFVRSELDTIRKSLSGLAADQAFVHSNAITANVINDKNPGSGIQIQGVIDILDAQNQAALKVMPAVVGKNDNATTASVEARLFAMSADSLNESVASLLSNVLTFGLRLAGYQGRAEVKFLPVEMRPILELEPQLTMKSARLRQELSLGTITDIEFHMQMFGRPAPAGAPQLSGTNFLAPNAAAASVDATNQSPNGDSLGRGMAPPGGSRAAKSNATKSGSVAGG